jgi:amidase
VRAPASHCGLVGLRPTHGRISLLGCRDLSPSFDTCGWFARDLPTFGRVADVLLGPDPAPLPTRPRLLRPHDVWALLDTDVGEALRPAAERVRRGLGAEAVVDVSQGDFDAMYWHFRHLQGREAWLSDGDFIRRFAPPLGPGVAERFAFARDVSDEQVAAATIFREAFRARLAALLGTDGVLVLPSMPDVAPLRSASEASLEDYRNRAIRMLCIAGLAGLPQLSLPWATRLAAPLGLGLIGPAGSDRSLVALAASL